MPRWRSPNEPPLLSRVLSRAEQAEPAPVCDRSQRARIQIFKDDSVGACVLSPQLTMISLLRRQLAAITSLQV